MGYQITNDSMDGHYIVHTKDGEVQFNKDEIGLTYIDEKIPRTYPSYRQSGRFLKATPIKISPRLNLIAKTKE